MILLGELSLWVALLMAAWSTTVSFAGGLQERGDLIHSGERALYATAACTAVACMGLWSALVTHDFSNGFVALHTGANVPTVYALTAFWSGEAGRLLLWTLILALYATVAVVSNRRVSRDTMPWVTGTLALMCLCSLMAICFGANPYARLDWMPPDGRGVDPRLLHLGRATHTPLLYFGLVASTVPFAFAVGGLVARRVDQALMGTIRRWTMLSWCWLTIAIGLGMRWAYREPGGVGSWALDAVQQASVVPWLTSAALLHSIVVQERRGLLRRWNILLIVATFVLAVLGAFVTREGDAAGTIAFDQSAIGVWLLGFAVATAVGAAYLIVLRPPSGDMRRLDRTLSREVVLLSCACLLTALSVALLSATLAPFVSGVRSGAREMPGGAGFITIASVGGSLWMLTATVGVLVAWRRGSLSALRRQLVVPSALGVVSAALVWGAGIQNGIVLVTTFFASVLCAALIQDVAIGARASRRMFGRGRIAGLATLVLNDRRRYGGYVVYLGVAVACVALTGIWRTKELAATVKIGETITTNDALGHQWTFTSQGVSRYSQPDRNVVAVSFRLTRDGKPAGSLSSEQRQYLDTSGEPTFEPWTEVGLLEAPSQDVRVAFTGVVGADRAGVQIRFSPLTWWVWVGCITMAVGGLIGIWPSTRPGREER